MSLNLGCVLLEELPFFREESQKHKQQQARSNADPIFALLFGLLFLSPKFLTARVRVRVRVRVSIRACEVPKLKL